MLVGTVARIGTIAIALLLALAVVHKGRVIARGGAASEPLVKVSRLRSLHARAVLTLTAGIEAVLVVLLVGSPTVGLAATTALTIAYAFELRRLEPDEPCNCFGDVLRVAS